MKSLQRKIFLIVSLSSILLCQWWWPFGSDGKDRSDGLNIFYIFDASGSFHEDALPRCITLAEKIHNDISDINGILPIFPQTHQFSTIKEISMGATGNCIKPIDSPTILDTHDTVHAENECLNKIKLSPRAEKTDISGAIANASESMELDSYYGKAIIIFSDFDETAHRKITSSLENIIVYAIHEYSEIQINNKSYEKDKNEFIDMLLDNGCKEENIKFVELNSVIHNPGAILRFLYEKFD